MPEKMLPAKAQETNLQLIAQVFEEIRTIYHNKTHETVYAIGLCLCKNFYGGDIERIRKNTPVDGQSLNKLAQQCSEHIAGLSRAWLYASVNLLVDRHDLAGWAEYDKLSVSHKHSLLQVKGIEAKKGLTLEILDKELSVRKTIEQTKIYLDEHPESRVSKKKKTKKTLLQLLGQAHLLGTPEFRHLKSARSMEKLSKKELDRILKATEKQSSLNDKKISKLKEKQNQLGDIFRYFGGLQFHQMSEEYLAIRRKEEQEKHANKLKREADIAEGKIEE